MPDPRDTPAMRQYYRFKRAHPGCVLLFRIGDFYEMFDDDAVAVSKAIGLTLTQRTEGVPMCGMPHHQLEVYLRKLLDAGFRAAVCEQTQDASEAKAGSVIERAVTRVLTPGTLVDDALLDESAPSTLAAVCFTGEGDTSAAAIACVDLSTGRFEVLDAGPGQIADELSRRRVTELLFSQNADGEVPGRVARVLQVLGLAGTPQPAWHFRQDEALDALVKHYGVRSLEGFGLSDDDAAARAAGAIIRYLQTTQAIDAGDQSIGIPGQRSRRSLAHLQPPKRNQVTEHLVLDGTTLRALEVLRTIRGPAQAAGANAVNEADGSLLGIFAPSRVFPGCRTAMGKRLLRERLCQPLRSAEAIESRQRCVRLFIDDRRTAAALAEAMSSVQDISRIAGRMALGRTTPRDLVGLGRSLAQIEPVHQALELAPAFGSHRAAIAELVGKLQPFAAMIVDRCVESPPAHMRDGGLFRDGLDPELDEARLLQRDAASWMAAYQASLIDTHQLPSLKVGYNKIFGYYIELPSAQSRRAPDTFTRKQTLKSAERYITPELKEFEAKVTTAEARALAREHALFDELCERAIKLIPEISLFGDTIADLDVLACFAEKAHRRGWTAPQIVREPVLILTQGRHPVLDEKLESNFVPNDLTLGAPEYGPADAVSAPARNAAPLALITGPNMAGKSTYIRTAALLTLLAHTGSFVPAAGLTIGLTDRIFTRIGADDALHAGQSTFMVEMTETARILNHATPQSLIILDEIGRGTSTLDGLSLAWAIAETLAGPGTERADRGPRTLFATHYHELTDLEELLPGCVRNLHVAVREWGEEIVFLHRILPGRTDQSYGIHVAKLAGLPSATIARARQVLDTLAVQHHAAPDRAQLNSASRGSTKKVASSSATDNSGQLSLFKEYVQHPAIDSLREVKLEALSPLEAFDTLRKLKDLATQGPKT